MKTPCLAACCLLVLIACREEESAGLPPAIEMSADALGHYCQMSLGEHPGPKAQVHLEGLEQPIFFAQVRDGIAYQRMPEQSNQITVIYVSDMGVAPSWENPGTKNWIAATAAFYVLGSEARGGMGAEEVVPFAVRTQAEGFASTHGGRVVTLAQIADSDVLAPVGPAGAGAEDVDYQDRLQSLQQEGKG